MLGLHCHAGFSLVAVSSFLIAAASFAVEDGPAWTSVVAAPGCQNAGSVVVARGLSFSAAYGIFPDQRSNPCLLHWQVDSLAPSHQESPVLILNFTWKHIWYQNKICHFKSSEISFSFHDLNRVHHLLKWKLKYPFILHQTIHMIVNNQKHFYLKNCFFLS